MAYLNGKKILATNGVSISNPNLLINSNFAINQRGASSYVGSKYTCDRWKNNDANTTCTIESDGVTISGTTFQYCQQIENFSNLNGMKLTLSAKINNKIYFATQRFDSSITDTAFCAIITDDGFVLRLRRLISTFFVQLTKGNASAQATAKINWVKLEVGSFPTAYVPPIIAEELPKCQRYYQKFGGENYSFIGSGVCFNTSVAVVILNFIVEMRTKPTISNSGSFRIQTSSNHTISSLSFYTQTTKNVQIQATSSDAIIAGHGAVLQANNDNSAYIELDAELY